MLDSFRRRVQAAAVVSLTLGGAFATLPALAQTAPAAPPTQVSDADRAAARELFYEGVKLQNDGKFETALDRLTRAQRIFNAPTHLLHIAECQVALLQLVEGAETYRTLVRTPLAPGAPAVFTQARDQGAAELAQVEPRIPSVKIDVTPQNVPNLQVLIDGAPMNTALVGVSRPINPGSHKITASAPGYAKQEVPLAIKERESKSLPITLQSQGVVYGPAVAPVPGPAPVTTQPETTPPPPPPYNPQQPPPATAPPPDQNPAEKRSSSSLLLGVRGGALIPAGTVAKQDVTTTTSSGTKDVPMSDVVATGGALGIEGGVRLFKRFAFFLGYEHGFLGKGDNTGAYTGTTGITGTNSSTLSSNLIDFHAAFISNPDGVGFYAELGAGYRWLAISEDLSGGASVLGSTVSSASNKNTLSGTELELGVGLYIKAGKALRFIPKLSVSGGSFTKLASSCSGVNCKGGIAFDRSDNITNTATHTFVFLGIGGYYNIDLEKK